MKLVMIKFFMIFIIFHSMNTFAGVSIVGTRFFFDNHTKAIKIKILNDNESEYIIKTEIKNNKDEFIISPPLLLIKKNESNIVSIIPDTINSNKDKVFNLILTSIPKTSINSGNTINLATRSHFKLVYRHKQINEKILSSLILKSNSLQESLLINPTESFISFNFLCNSNNEEIKKMNIYPKQTILVPNCNHTQISLIKDDGSIASFQNINPE